MMLITSQNKNPHNTEGKNRKYIKRFKKVKRKYIKRFKKERKYIIYFFFAIFYNKNKEPKNKNRKPEERTN